MRERTILLHFFAVPLRQRLVAAGIAVVMGSGLFVWSRYSATPPATTAVLSFDAGAVRQAEPGIMNANAKEPAVAIAQSILSDEVVGELAKQAGVPFTGSKSDAAKFRSRLDMAQTPASLLRVNYKDTDQKLSAAVANAFANMLVAWTPTPDVATATSAPGRPGAPLAGPAFAKSGHQRPRSHSWSPPLRELEMQLAVTNRKLTALYARAIASQKANAAVPRAASSAKLDADANETVRLRLERVRLMQAIVAEKRREAGLRDQTAPSVGDSALAVQTVSPRLPRHAPVRPSLNPVAGQIWQRPFTLVRLAGDAGAVQSESGLLWYWPLAGILCGLLYLGGAILRYRAIERAAPALNNNLSAEKATEYAGSFMQTEDRWTEEVLKSLALTGIGHQDEPFAARHKPLAVDRVRDNIERNPNSWTAHSEEARIALAPGDTGTAMEPIKLATTRAPEEVKAQLSKIVIQRDSESAPDVLFNKGSSGNPDHFIQSRPPHRNV
jgi:hypothetical protein